MVKDKKLPSPDFCNRDGVGKPNPIPGMGALGNQYTGRMYYTGSESDKEQWVTLVQEMLLDLGYSVGDKGADGKFGNDTEKAVKKFQEEHEDWGGEKLNVDGLVGPETADALNRAMVEIDGWYDEHQTENDLTKTFALLTTMKDALKEPVSFDVNSMEKGKVVVVGSNRHIFSVRLHGTNRQPLGNAPYRVVSSDLELSGISNADGWVRIKIDTDRCYDHITLEWDQNEPSAETLRKDLIMDCDGVGDENEQAKARLHNIGYNIDTSLEQAVKTFQGDYFIPGEYGLDEQGNIPPLTKEHLWFIYKKGECEASPGALRPDDPSIQAGAEADGE